ncbi:MAG: hypothetical protein WCP14_02215 [bacterium]
MAYGDKTEVKDMFGNVTHVEVENFSGSKDVYESNIFGGAGDKVGTVSTGMFGGASFESTNGNSTSVNSPLFDSRSNSDYASSRDGINAGIRGTQKPAAQSTPGSSSGGGYGGSSYGSGGGSYSGGSSAASLRDSHKSTPSTRPKERWELANERFERYTGEGITRQSVTNRSPSTFWSEDNPVVLFLITVAATLVLILLCIGFGYLVDGLMKFMAS